MISLSYTEQTLTPGDDLERLVISTVFKKDHRDYGQGDRKYDDPMHPYRVTGM